MKYKGMKSLKRILLAIIIVSSIMAISVSANTNAKDNNVIDIVSTLAAITGNDNIGHWFAYPIHNKGYNLQTVVDGSCLSSQINPCGIIINYNLS